MFPYFLAICKKYILRQNLQGNQSLFVQFVFHIVLSFQVKYDYYVPITNYNLTLRKLCRIIYSESVGKI